MQQEEETWIRNEWGLRQCSTWSVGYCGYRSAAALRGTTMMKLLDNLLYFGGWKWAKKRSEPQATYKTCKQYEHWFCNAEQENYIEDSGTNENRSPQNGADSFGTVDGYT